MYYTYLIGWSAHNLWYYGVRYSKNSKPDDLLQTYFTSSNFVKDYIVKLGLPDIKEVRRVFNTKEQAIIWEHKVLRRMKVVKKNNWINKTDNKAICSDSEKANKARINNSLLGAAYTKGKQWEQIIGQEAASKKKAALSLRSKQMWDQGLMNSKKPNDTTNYKRAAKQRWQDPELKKIHSQRMKVIWQQRKDQNLPPSLNGSASEKSKKSSDSVCISKLSESTSCTSKSNSSLINE